MAQYVVPTGSAPNQAVIDLYLSVFDSRSVDARLDTLQRHGVGDLPVTKPRELAMRSLAWATAAEVGLYTLTTTPDRSALHTADALTAALRVARGLIEDTRSHRDPVVDELLVAADRLSEALPHPASAAELVTRHRSYRDALAAPSYDLNDYLAALPTHSISVVGLLLGHQQLVADPAVASSVEDFAVSLGCLYQVTTEISAATDPAPTHPNHLILSRALGSRQGHAELTDYIATRSRTLLDTTPTIRDHYSVSPMLDEVLQRANLTLRACADFLRAARPR